MKTRGLASSSERQKIYSYFYPLNPLSRKKFHLDCVFDFQCICSLYFCTKTTGKSIDIHASNKSGRHLEFSMNDIRGQIIHVAKMALPKVKVLFTLILQCFHIQRNFFYFISRGIFSLYNSGYVIVTLKVSSKEIPG